MAQPHPWDKCDEAKEALAGCKSDLDEQCNLAMADRPKAILCAELQAICDEMARLIDEHCHGGSGFLIAWRPACTPDRMA